MDTIDRLYSRFGTLMLHPQDRDALKAFFDVVEEVKPGKEYTLEEQRVLFNQHFLKPPTVNTAADLRAVGSTPVVVMLLMRTLVRADVPVFRDKRFQRFSNEYKPLIS